MLRSSPGHVSAGRAHVALQQRPVREVAIPVAVDVGSADALLTSGRMVVAVGEIEVLVFRTPRGVFAVENRCPHTGRTLSDAVVRGRKLTCVGHDRSYSLSSGRPVGRVVAPMIGLRRFAVTITDGRLWLSEEGAR